MSSDDVSKKMLDALSENPGFQALRRLEEEGVLVLGEPVAQPKALTPHVEVVSRTTSSSDPVVSRLIEIYQQIETLDGMPELGETVRLSLHIVLETLHIGALVRGAIPAPGHDPVGSGNCGRSVPEIMTG